MGSIIFDNFDPTKEDSPAVEMSNHFNKVYFYFDFNKASNNILNIAIDVYKFSNINGIPEEENILDSDFFSFPAAMTVYSNDDNLPKHHAFLDIENYWYMFKITYVYKPFSLPEEGNTFYSNATYLFLDNTFPNIYNGYFKNIDQNIKIFIEPDNNIEPDMKVGDIVKYKEANAFKEIAQIDTNSLQLKLANPKIIEIILKIVNNINFEKVLNDYFNNNLPLEGEIIFKHNHNHINYNITFKGNMIALKENT
jgi:hypothetical protein